MLDSLTRVAINHLPLAIVLGCIAYFIHNKANGLRKFPGPPLAAFTDLWRFYNAWLGHAELTQIDLHRKYGKVVRLGPNMLTFSDPAVLKDIYGLNLGFTKTEFYHVQQNVVKGERMPSLFSTTDEAYHAQFRRRVSSAFAMSTLVSYEPLVDETIEVFLARTRELYASTGAVCNMARWLQFFAFDVIGQITFSKRLGFLDRNEDVNGIVQGLARVLEYFGYIGQLPWLDRYVFDKNPIKLWLMKHNYIKSSSAVGQFTLDCMADRPASAEKQSDDETRTLDLLSRFRRVQQRDPEFMTDRRVLIMCSSLTNAGSDTTAISLSSVLYYLLQNPTIYRKLMKELEDGIASNTIKVSSKGVVSWSDAQKLPYLDAVIQEAFRMFPAVGLPLERYTPPGGAVIGGEHIPGGTIVGINAWVLHRQEEVFGVNVDKFRPERWIEASADQRRKMAATMFQFGTGARTCIGKNISLLEIYKVIPSFLLNFELDLVHPEKEWKTLNCWFVRQLDFETRVKVRNSSAKVH